MSQMKAVVWDRPGSPKALHIKQSPLPEPRLGQVLIRVHVFGLNQSQRKGASSVGMAATLLGKWAAQRQACRGRLA